MSNYIRYYLPGGCYFFTVVTYHRRPIFANANHIMLLKSAFKKVKAKFPFSMNAFVILPDHLHCLWKLPENDSDYSTRWRLIKRYFSMEFDKKCNSRGEKEIWQRRFWEHTIKNEKDWKNHLNYIHYNPVKHGYVRAAKDWHESSFLYWVEQGFYEKNWGAL